MCIITIQRIIVSHEIKLKIWNIIRLWRIIVARRVIHSYNIRNVCLIVCTRVITFKIKVNQSTWNRHYREHSVVNDQTIRVWFDRFWSQRTTKKRSLTRHCKLSHTENKISTTKKMYISYFTKPIFFSLLSIIVNHRKQNLKNHVYRHRPIFVIFIIHCS